jgi:hypothetical protein
MMSVRKLVNFFTILTKLFVKIRDLIVRYDSVVLSSEFKSLNCRNALLANFRHLQQESKDRRLQGTPIATILK